jgi:hypothetical protein
LELFLSNPEDSIGNSINFYNSLKGEGLDIRAILAPLDALTPRERAIFIEYHYWKTHMKVIACSDKVKRANAYGLMLRAFGRRTDRRKGTLEDKEERRQDIPLSIRGIDSLGYKGYLYLCGA